MSCPDSPGTLRALGMDEAITSAVGGMFAFHSIFTTQKALGATKSMLAETARLFPGYADPNNHTETILITTLLGQ